MIRKSERVRKIHSDIRGPLYEEALRMQAAGTKVLKLNTGNPASFGFTLPDSVRKAVTEHLDEAVAYCDVKGMPAARETILRYHQSRGLQGITMDDIFIGNGVSEVASMLMTALMGSADEILMPAPCYSLWSNNAYTCGSIPVFYRCDELSDWNPDIADLKKKVTSRTRALVIINPNNPTGVLYSTEVLQELIEVARQHNLIIFSDEIYDRLVMDNLTHVATARLAPDLTVITMNGLSKSHSLCGYRCGWMVISGPRERTEEYRKGIVQLTSLRLCSNALAQLVIPAALEDMETPAAMVRPGGRLYEQRRATIETLDRIEGISYVKNVAAFYLFPKLDVKKFNITNDKQFARDLLTEAKILIVPGSGFDWPDPDHFRIVMLPEAGELRAAMERMGNFLDGYKQK